MSAPSGPGSARRGQLYANYLEVGHNAAEFVLAFGTFNEGEADPHVHTLVFTSPGYARAFCNVLQTALEQYESRQGEAEE